MVSWTDAELDQLMVGLGQLRGADDISGLVLHNKSLHPDSGDPLFVSDAGAGADVDAGGAVPPSGLAREDGADTAGKLAY